MKTSVVEVRDLLAGASVLKVEKTIGEIDGVESATVDFAAGKAPARFDEPDADQVAGRRRAAALVHAASRC